MTFYLQSASYGYNVDQFSRLVDGFWRFCLTAAAYGHDFSPTTGDTGSILRKPEASRSILFRQNGLAGEGHFAVARMKTDYYNPAIHAAAFAPPEWFRRLVP